MAPDAQRLRIRHVTSAGTTLALSLAPLVIGVLFARTMTLDPHTPVNALITRGGRGAVPSPAQWGGCGRTALRRCRSACRPLARPKIRFPRVRRLP
ncbi:hypothetical protein SAMN05216483_0625 [Streptomyces sp. 2131.1]|uniref:hypothetical protein n=1 Tax=Streptomyces sp. 2131.1 TaxID=1855346 RepID=UPI00089D61C5|nr:hypothetical protein [Streptomyces sp. 2131.1]SEB88384.1 hypothetical protein SAMN05216483_0625 [Streptomyces sp. 2131.1]